MPDRRIWRTRVELANAIFESSLPVNALANVVAGGQVSLTSTGDFGITASGGNVVLWACQPSIPMPPVP